MSQSNSSTNQAGLFQQLQGLDTRYWIVNIMEMFERLAYYGVRAVIAIYMVLPREAGGPQFTHVEKGQIFAWWAGLQSVLPMFTGGYADRYGHKKTIAFAIVLKIIGYIMMAKFLSFWGFFAGCMFLATGTAIFKPGVQGTLAATLKDSNASVGWGVFYHLVNVGGFLGPVLAGLLRLMSWEYVFYACAVIVAINFLWLPFYKDPSEDFEVTEDMSSPLKVFVTSVLGLFRPRIFFFCIVFSGFWVMFNQVFDLLPNYIDDWVNSSGIIATVGQSFSTPAFPTFLAAALALIFGGICAVGVLLAMRPDHRPAEEVGYPAYIVVAIALTAAFYVPLLRLNQGIALLTAPFLGLLVSAIAFDLYRVPAKVLAWVAFIPATLGTFFFLRENFLAYSPILIEMAKNGAQVNPEWMLNINPGLIVFTMIFFAYISSYMKPLTSIMVGMAIATAGSVLAGTATFGWLCLAGITVFSIGEMLSSPKKMEYLATLSPKGQEGLYMGYANIPVAIGWISGSIIAGSLYEEHGDKVNLAKQFLETTIGMSKEAITVLPKSEVVPTLAAKLNMTALETQQMLFELYRPDAIWIRIGLIGLASIIGMFIYDRVLKAVDKKA